jgi:hypothetical protein
MLCADGALWLLGGEPSTRRCEPANPHDNGGGTLALCPALWQAHPKVHDSLLLLKGRKLSMLAAKACASLFGQALVAGIGINMLLRRVEA